MKLETKLSKKTKTLTTLLCGVLIAFGSVAQAAELKPVYPQCLRLETAILKPGQAPEFSWGLDADGRDGAAQSAYQIKVTKPGGATVWDSGKVASEDTLDVPYVGPALEPSSQYDWQVRVFDEKDNASDWTPPQRFFTAIADWKGEWITSPEVAALTGDREALLADQTAKMLRTEWEIAKPVKTATLYITSMGSCRGWINGRPVSEDRLTPSVTQFGWRVFYRAYDVAELLDEGPNALSVLLGGGAFMRDIRSTFGAEHGVRLLAQLEIEYADGSRESVATGPDWRSMQEKSPWREIHYDLGGIYDARLFDPAWTTVDYDDGGWKQAALLPPAAGLRIDPEMVQACRPGLLLKPVAEYEPEPGVYVFDLGQQFTGICRFTVDLPEGHAIHLRHAQALTRDRNLDVSNLKANSENETTYIAAGGGSEHFEGLPFHFNGCRYVEIKGLPSRDALVRIEGVHLADVMRETSDFRSSDQRLNQLWSMIRKTYSSNLKTGILMDCVGRRERAAWLGDGYTGHILTLGYFFDGAAHHRKRMQDIRDQVAYRGGTTPPGQVGCRAPSFGAAACPYWSDAATLAPRDARIFYSDEQIVRKQYGKGDGQAAALMDFYEERNGTSGKWTQVKADGLQVWGPWLDRAMHLPPGSGKERWNSLDFPSPWFWRNKDKLPNAATKEAFGTMWWAMGAQAVADMASVLNNTEDARYYEDMAERSRQALIRDFDNGDGTWDLNDQTIYLYGLASGAAAGETETLFLKRLIEAINGYGGHFTAGSDSVRMTFQILSAYGYADLAWFMAMRPEMPSFGYMIDAGATSVWERFDLYHPEWGLNQIGGTLAFNHVGNLPVAQWIVEDIVGLRPDPAQPGFKHFFIRPWTGSEPKDNDFRFDSPRGPIRVAWQRDGDKVTLDATVPPNTTATVQWPDGKEENLTSGTHTLTGDAPLKKGEGVEGGLDEIRRYFKENPYDPAKDTNRHFEIKAQKEAKEAGEVPEDVTAVESSGVFTPVIEWNMEKMNADGNVKNTIEEAPYANAELQLTGAKVVDDPERGKVLSFDGEGATAETLVDWDGHHGVRIEMMVRSDAPTGQSVILAVPNVFRVFKVAGFAKIDFSSRLKPDARENSAGIPVLQTGAWRKVVAEFDPARGEARIESEGKSATLPIGSGDALVQKNGLITLGNRINAFFQGQIDDIRISVMD